jgi:choline dehydrogenase-like flavoprotein
MIPAYLPSTLETGKPGKRYVSFLIGLQHMFGRGTVHISSADPFNLPTVNPNVLKEEVDMEILMESIKFIRRLVQTPPYKNVVIEEVLPGPQAKTDEDIKEYIRASVNTIHHPASTASMLPREDGGVVGPDLKVYGTANLRIVRHFCSVLCFACFSIPQLDTSIIPVHITGHPTQLLYAMAERVRY